MEKDTQNQQKLDQIGGAVEQQFHIKIAGDGRWFHEGGEIHRKALVKLFSTVLRPVSYTHLTLPTIYSV